MIERTTGGLAAIALVVAFALVVGDCAHARVEAVTVTSREPVLGGRAFSDAGSYEKLTGTITFHVDPANDANRAIVDLARAPRREGGHVVATANFMALVPVDRPRRDRVALVEVSNRGGKAALRYFNDASSLALDPTGADDFGDGFLMRLGLTVIWVGWQFDVPDEAGRLRLEVPFASDNGRVIKGLVRSDWVVDSPIRTLALAHRDHWTYPAIDHDDERVRLTVRSRREGARTLVPRSRWRFARESARGPVPDATHIYMEDGFAPGSIYELVYVAQDPRVVGLGLAAIRDTLSYAKYERDSVFPASKGLAFGVSQTGRFLRHFLYQGFNVDEAGRKVYDGMFIHTAGAGRGSFNHRFGQPSRDAHRYATFFYPTDLFPFTGRIQRDPVTKGEDGLLSHYASPSLLPRIFYTNTSYEYWGRAAALIHVSPDGLRDVEPLPVERYYHLAGAQHFVEPWPPAANARMAKTVAWRGNPVDFLVNLRALLRRLVHWVCDDRAPPASRYPRLDDDTLVPVRQLVFPSLPGISAPRQAHVAYRADYGPDWERGIVTKQPPDLGRAFPALVPQVDGLGHEIAGVKNVELRVPLATYTGWHLRHGLKNPGEMVDFRGTTALFPYGSEEAKDGNDPRPSIESLYADQEQFLGEVDRAALELTKQGFLLEEDHARIRRRAMSLWTWMATRGGGGRIHE